MNVRLVIGLGLLALAATPNAGTVQTAGAAAPAITKGEQVYAAQKCATCHALDGKGQAKGPLDGVGTKLTADEIREWIVESRRDDQEAQGPAQAA